jgi:hypothetical protein
MPDREDRQHTNGHRAAVRKNARTYLKTIARPDLASLRCSESSFMRINSGVLRSSKLDLGPLITF